jgi:hypothetical protein
LRNSVSLALLIATALVFAAGLAWLFNERIQSGRLYPRYASVRTDPFGSRALYETLDRMPAITASRNRLPLHRLEIHPAHRKDTVLFISGASWPWFALGTSDTLKHRHLDELIRSGLRLVIAIDPESSEFFVPKYDSDKTDPQDDAKDKVPDQGNNAGSEPGQEPLDKGDTHSKDRQEDSSSGEGLPFRKWLEELWEFKAVKRSPPQEDETAERVTPAPLEGELPIFSAWVFPRSDLAREWSVLYRRGPHPVIIERNLGEGSIVIASDTYFLSNEGIRFDRMPKLILHLVDGRSRVMFDDTHVGIEETDNFAKLLRRYRLEGFLIGLGLLLALVIWRNSSRLAPPLQDDETEHDTGQSAGRGTAAGLVTLLRRHLPSNQLIETCAGQWREACGKHTAKNEERWKRVQAALADPSAIHDPVAVYRQIHHALAEKREPPPKNLQPTQP